MSNTDFTTYVMKDDVSGKHHGTFYAVNLHSVDDIERLLELMEHPEAQYNVGLVGARHDWVVRNNTLQTFSVFTDEEFKKTFEVYDFDKAMAH